ncbi:hypothetical protein [Rhodopirellula europaea]|uniref:Uncharacterized protein n=1 Tax=Rhodopirellula europaea 6C TaxID=1263867 RepID=M2AKS9_9BACT|nr:hypothetical protein [Rhodopirellula europaea]EMB17730.1 hypothetical protein RE6C_01592 [Rhodopirellula europaea 6C]
MNSERDAFFLRELQSMVSALDLPDTTCLDPTLLSDKCWQFGRLAAFAMRELCVPKG